MYMQNWPDKEKKKKRRKGKYALKAVPKQSGLISALQFGQGTLLNKGNVVPDCSDGQKTFSLDPSSRKRETKITRVTGCTDE